MSDAPFPLLNVKLEPAEGTDAAALMRALAGVAACDPLFVPDTNTYRGEITIHGVSEKHLAERLASVREAGFTFTVGLPLSDYRNTLAAPGQFEGVYETRNSTGMLSDAGYLTLAFAPRPAGSGFAVEDPDGLLAPSWRRAVQAAIEKDRQRGPGAMPIEDFVARVVLARPGHDETAERSLGAAASDAYRKMVGQVGTVTAEPMMRAEVAAPASAVAAVREWFDIRDAKQIARSLPDAAGMVRLTYEAFQSSLWNIDGDLAALDPKVAVTLTYDRFEPTRWAKGQKKQGVAVFRLDLS